MIIDKNTHHIAIAQDGTVSVRLKAPLFDAQNRRVPAASIAKSLTLFEAKSLCEDLARAIEQARRP